MVSEESQACPVSGCSLIESGFCIASRFYYNNCEKRKENR